MGDEEVNHTKADHRGGGEGAFLLPDKASLKQRYAHDTAKVLTLRMAGVRVAFAGDPCFVRRKSAVFALICLSPLVIATLWQFIRPTWSPLTTSYFFWLAYFLLISTMCVLLSWIGCRAFYSSADHLEAILTTEGRKAYDQWADKYTRTRRQLPFMVIFSVASAASLRLASEVPGMSNRLYVTPVSYIAVLWTGFLVANAGYWLAHGTLLAYRLTRPGHMKPLWTSPSRSPGIESLARCYRYSFYMSTVGTSVCVTPLLQWVYKGPQSAQLTLLKIAILGVTLAITLSIAILPQLWLSHVVSDARLKSLRMLHDKLPAEVQRVTDWADRELTSIIGTIKVVGDSPSSTVNDRTIAALILGLTTILLPYVAQVTSS